MGDTSTPTADPGPRLGVTPAPTDAEAAAIAAAIEVCWPRPAGSDDAVAASRWRWSGRWWSKPIPSRRDRPN